MVAVALGMMGVSVRVIVSIGRGVGVVVVADAGDCVIWKVKVMAGVDISGDVPRARQLPNSQLKSRTRRSEYSFIRIAPSLPLNWDGFVLRFDVNYNLLKI
jgi:hypothetical protein